ncbi:hypothetical protein MSIM_03120 [Mycobacterium simiae]|nr:hypothetical protein MSIM_03120 [Mycobacterium simiae]
MLERTNLARQHRLGDMQAGRSAAEVEFLRNGDEIAQLAHVQIRGGHTERVSLRSEKGVGRVESAVATLEA